MHIALRLSPKSSKQISQCLFSSTGVLSSFFCFNLSWRLSIVACLSTSCSSFEVKSSSNCVALPFRSLFFLSNARLSFSNFWYFAFISWYFSSDSADWVLILSIFAISLRDRYSNLQKLAIFVSRTIWNYFQFVFRGTNQKLKYCSYPVEVRIKNCFCCHF